jgi:hypothetical protein
MTTSMPRCRPFKLIDIMILTASAAGWMAAVRSTSYRLSMIMIIGGEESFFFDHAGTVAAGVTMAFLALAVAYVWIRLIPPRLPTLELIRQPGMLLLEVSIGLSLLYAILSMYVPLVDSTKANMIIALILGLSWCAACHHYRSRAEPGWIEGLADALQSA